MPSAITRILVIADLGWSAISFGLSIMKSLIVAYALVMAFMDRMFPNARNEKPTTNFNQDIFFLSQKGADE